jgi:hypothetical protein
MQGGRTVESFNKVSGERKSVSHKFHSQGANLCNDARHQATRQLRFHPTTATLLTCPCEGRHSIELNHPSLDTFHKTITTIIPPEMAIQNNNTNAPVTIDIEMHSISSGAAISKPTSIYEVVENSSHNENIIQSSGPVLEQIQTVWSPYKNRFRLLACCMTAFGNGLNDSAPGALIASMER